MLLLLLLLMMMVVCVCQKYLACVSFMKKLVDKQPNPSLISAVYTVHIHHPSHLHHIPPARSTQKSMFVAKMKPNENVFYM